MGRRGPKPVDIRLLDFWDFEFYKAFHALRDGVPLPESRSGWWLDIPPAELLSMIDQLTRMTAIGFWLATRRMYAMAGDESIDLRKPPSDVDRWFGQSWRNQEIFRLKRALRSRRIQAQSTRHKIWRDLTKANTYADLRKVCGRWARLPDVLAMGMTPFPQHVVTYAAQFFLMRRNERFPTAEYADNARMDYLARGMAGAIVGVSPMTAIERLRNIKHEQKNPLWSETLQGCDCWRCRVKNFEYASDEKVRGEYEDQLRNLVKVAATTKVPREWEVNKGNK